MIMRKVLTVLTLSFVLLLAFQQRGEAQRLAVKSNLAPLFALAPDLGVELVTGERTSVSFSVLGHPSGWPMNYSLLVLQPEFRYWFNGRPLTREFVGIGAFAADYDLSFPSGHGQKNYFKGNGLALGITGGYVLNLGRRLNVELGGGTGFMFFRQKHFYEDDHYEEYFVEEQSRINTWGYKLFPVKFDITVIYILK